MQYHRALSIWLICFCVLGMAACAPMMQYYPQMNELMLRQDYGAALELHRKNKQTFGKRNEVLYYLDEGLLAHFAGRYAESNESFFAAERLMEGFYTRSLSQEAASFLINDNTTAYRGEDFEAALVNMFLALNYVGLGQWEEALVEARKVDSKLTTFNVQYPAGKKNVYKEDAFIRFIMGLLYESVGEKNDAFISLRQSEQIYRQDYRVNYGVSAPEMVIEKLLQSAKAMGFNTELGQIRKAYPDISRRKPPGISNAAEVYLIDYNGRGSEKVERFFFIPMPDGYVLKFAYPEFEKRPFSASGCRIDLKNAQTGQQFTTRTILAEDLSSIAEVNLKNRIGRVQAKAVARVTAKYLLAKEAENQALRDGDRDLANIIRFTFQTYMIAFENADIRHWRLLPAQIQVARAVIPEGEYQGEIQLLDNNGNPINTRPIAPFSIQKGEKKLIPFRTME
jgi:uncharacterized protein